MSWFHNGHPYHLKEPHAVQETHEGHNLTKRLPSRMSKGSSKACARALFEKFERFCVLEQISPHSIRALFSRAEICVSKGALGTYIHTYIHTYEISLTRGLVDTPRLYAQSFDHGSSSAAGLPRRAVSRPSGCRNRDYLT